MRFGSRSIDNNGDGSIGEKAKKKGTERRRKTVGRKFRKQRLVPYPVECFGDVEGHDVGFPKIPKRGGPDMGDIGKKITS